MDIVIRTAQDRFLQEVAFPIFEMGMVNARIALERLERVLADDRTHLLVEMLLARGVEGTAFWNLDADNWLETMYRLLFRQWEPSPEGWLSPEEIPGYAGDWEESLHLALMLEHPRYPYWDEAESQVLREACMQAPDTDLGLAAFACGLWDPEPMFAPHEVLSLQQDRGVYKPGERVLADWSYRPAEVASIWAQQLPNKLGRLLKREEMRLKPLDMPEASEILSYWLGKQAEPPVLAVAFSGLGPQASGWVRSIGEIVRQIRGAAEQGRGLTMILPKSVEERDYGI